MTEDIKKKIEEWRKAGTPMDLDRWLGWTPQELKTYSRTGKVPDKK